MSDELQTQERTYQELLTRGSELSWAGQWQEAATAFSRAIQINPDEATPYLDLGLALFESGALREALDAYEGALRRSPGDVLALQKIADIHARLGEKLQAASTYGLLADRLMEERQPAQAVRAWQQVVRYDPRNRIALRRLADAYRRGRRNDLAAQATLALARLSADSDNPDEAKQLARQALQLQPELLPAQQLLAMLDAPSHQTTSTMRVAGPLTGPLHRGTGPLRRGTGPLDRDALRLDLGETGEGESSASPTDLAQQRALARLAEAFFEGDSGDLAMEALKAKAIDLQTRGLVEEAAKSYQEIIQGGGGSSDVYYTLGTLYQAMFRFDDAIAHFARVTATPDYAMAAHFAIGQSYQSQGRVDEALGHFLRAVESLDLQSVEREQADTIVRLFEGVADAYEAKGEVAQADQFINRLADFLTARGWDEELLELQTRLGPATSSGGGAVGEQLEMEAAESIGTAMKAATRYQEQGRYRAAIEELYWALPLAPHYLPIHNTLADLYLAMQRPEDAVAKLVMVAEVSLTRQNHSQATRALSRALEIAPLDQNARGKLIDLLVSHGEVDEALEHYLQLAEGFYQLAQGDRAVDKLSEALRMAPRGDPAKEWSLRIQRRLADLHIQRLDWRRAVSALEGIHSQRPDELEVTTQLVDMYYRLGAGDRALSVVENSANHLAERQGSMAMLRFVNDQAEQRPDNADLARLAGELRANVGDIEGAAKGWERAIELLVRRGERMAAIALLRRTVALRSAQERRYRAMLDHLLKQG